MKRRYEQFLYWTTIGCDVLLRGLGGSYYVLGYVKSGTNWLCLLLSDYLEIPVYEPWNDVLPRLNSRIFHMHRILPFRTVRKRTVYIMRDGRDTVVSRYFHDASHDVREKRDAEAFLGKPLRKEDIRDNLPRFIEFCASYSGSTVDYRTHLHQWMQHDYVTVKYEELLTEPVRALHRVLSELLGEEPVPERVEAAVERNTFKKKSKRDAGQENPDAFLRKGIAGDWKNYFTAEAARAFDAYAGDTLIRVGYEENHDWVNGVKS